MAQKRSTLSHEVLCQVAESCLQKSTGLALCPSELSSLVDKLDRTSSNRSRYQTTQEAAIGSRVKVLDLMDQQSAEITLVAPEDSRPEQAHISVLSPLGAGLLGCRPGEIVRVHMFGNRFLFRVCNVTRPEPVAMRE